MRLVQISPFLVLKTAKSSDWIELSIFSLRVYISDDFYPIQNNADDGINQDVL